MLTNLRDYFAIKHSGLFDEKYYLLHNPDVRRADIDPLKHFVKYGWKERRNPSELFGTDYYLSTYTDVANATINPLVHYIRFGKNEGRRIIPVGKIPNGQSDEINKIIGLLSGSPDVLVDSINNLLTTRISETSEAPLVTIIIPVYNHIFFTLNCIWSILFSTENIIYEIIIIDDCSTDDTYNILSKMHNIQYIRNEKNIGFLNSCNFASQFAKGKYLVFLNNDTIVLPGWLDSLINTFKEDDNIGLVGSKLLYSNGKLQEAGGVIFNDGTGINYGRGDDPNKPEYNFMREVDYCSGASICLPLSIWNEINGFDTRYSPAYYEDTDLAFQLRDKGYKVLYQPLSNVIHLEGGTSGTDTSKGVKKFQEINRIKFYEKWKDILVNYGDNKTSEFLYRNRQRQRRALVIDACIPMPDHDSGSIDTYNYLMTLRKLGFEVTFIPTDNSHINNKYVRDLQKRGVECIYFPYLESIDKFLENRGLYFDLILLFRAPAGGKYIDTVRKYAPHAKVIFNTVDLHFLRAERERQILGHSDNATLNYQGNLTMNDEIKIMKKADLTILVSEYEQKLLKSLDENIFSKVVPIPREIPGREIGFEPRKNIVFIGGFSHRPNVYAVEYFINDIWPLITSCLPECKFLIVGSDVTDEIRKFNNSNNIEVVGYVPDLSEIFSSCKLTVAPLLYGSGIKGKIITSLSYGVPCVATSVAVEGMKLINNENILIGDAPAEFSKCVINLYNDKQLWYKLSDSGLTFTKNNYSLEIFYNILNNIINNLLY